MRKITLLLLSICALLTVHAQTWQTVFYDDFNRADGALGGNYTTNYSVGISQKESGSDHHGVGKRFRNRHDHWS